jgi:hypothetical protein
MSLTSEQKRYMKAISKQLREIERIALENSIDLDVFITGYNEEGVSLYATEKISQKENAGKRKRIFEKHGKVTKKITSHKN